MNQPHFYELSHCAKCKNENVEGCHELGIPGENKIKHIALCDRCFKAYEELSRLSI